MIKLQGSIVITLKRRDKKEVIKMHNDVTPEFAILLGSLAMFGALPTYSGYAVPQYGLPSSVVIVAENNGVVVATIPVQNVSFSDNLSSQNETTQVTYLATDATPAQYTFNQLTLYTVVNNNLAVPVATVTLSQPLTKDSIDILSVKWTQEIISNVPLVNFCSYGQSLCSTSQCTQNVQNNLCLIPQASVLNLIWLLLIYPNVGTLLNQSSFPLQSLLRQVLQNNAKPAGIAIIKLFDSNFNLLASLYNFSANGEVKVGTDNVYFALNVFMSQIVQAQYAIPYVQFPFSAGVFYQPLAVLQIQNPAQVSTAVLAIQLKIPYGALTLQSLQTST